MSTSASATGLRVLAARESSPSASNSHVVTLSRPVLASTRDCASRIGKIRNRRASNTVGRAMSTSAGLRATASVISTPRSISTKSAQRLAIPFHLPDSHLGIGQLYRSEDQEVMTPVTYDLTGSDRYTPGKGVPAGTYSPAGERCGKQPENKRCRSIA